MNKLQFALVKNEEGSGIIVYVPGTAPKVADDTHPNFAKIVEGAENGDASVVKLFDVAETISEEFESLSERVSVKNGTVYLDNEPVHDSLTGQILRFMDEGEDFMPLVNFFENVQNNPNEHSREQLFSWLSGRKFTINAAGNIVGYKGVNPTGTDGGFESVHSGKAIVDGKMVNGRIPNKIGSTIEMPRGEVHHDPSQGCSTGLHVADFDYASGWGSVVLEVEVNPRDVVSVPTDSNYAKVRCCRYTVVGVKDSAYTTALRPTDTGVDHDGWGELEEDEDDLDLLDDLGAGEGVYRGDVFRDRHPRSNGRTLTVEYVDEDNGVATCKSSTGKTTQVSLANLTSRKYEQV
jgi:hypothetical protein